MIEIPVVCLHKLSHDRGAVALKFLRRGNIIRVINR